MAEKIKLTISEQIDRSKEGRSQSWIVNQLNKKGIPLNEVQFSRKKKGHSVFTQAELDALSEILSIKLISNEN